MLIKLTIDDHTYRISHNKKEKKLTINNKVLHYKEKNQELVEKIVGSDYFDSNDFSDANYIAIVDQIFYMLLDISESKLKSSNTIVLSNGMDISANGNEQVIMAMVGSDVPYTDYYKLLVKALG